MTLNELYIISFIRSKMGFPGSSDSKESACNARDPNLIPRSGRSIPWRREWLPTPVFLPGEFHGQRSLAGYSPWGHKELDTAEWLTLSFLLGQGSSLLCLLCWNLTMDGQWTLSNAFMHPQTLIFFSLLIILWVTLITFCNVKPILSFWDKSWLWYISESYFSILH